MIGTVRQFFEKYIKPSSDTAESVSEHALQVATASLFIEMMRADMKASESEHETILRTVKEKFDLTDEETDTLIRLAEKGLHRSTGYYEFTSLINKGFSYEQKKKVIEHLWEVAFADRTLDKHEEHMVRRIADLIYVSHRDFIDAKLTVRKRLHSKESRK